jgi:hypothetical protein
MEAITKLPKAWITLSLVSSASMFIVSPFAQGRRSIAVLWNRQTARVADLFDGLLRWLTSPLAVRRDRHRLDDNLGDLIARLLGLIAGREL